MEGREEVGDDRGQEMDEVPLEGSSDESMSTERQFRRR